ncbi:MAG: alpha/beta fold hydrolase [Solirubrobacteraceae bacterium]|nr:alpha/beta fold hydrolase [Solirubrobacteraceae bacterium]
MTYLLLPGAGGDARSWDLVADRLRARGHHVVAPDLPGPDPAAGLQTYADVAVAALAGRARPVVVGQSMGAFTAPLVAARVPVELLVLVCPMIPAPGEPAGAWWAATDQAAAYRESETRAGRDPDAPLDPATLLLHDVAPDVAERLLAEDREEAGRSWDDPWPLEAWSDVPTRVIVGARDRLFPEAFARRVARERLGVEADVIGTGHLPALARPDELAARLLACAPATA